MKKYKIIEFEVHGVYDPYEQHSSEIELDNLKIETHDISSEILFQMINNLTDEQQTKLTQKLKLYKKEAINLKEAEIIGDDFYILDKFNRFAKIVQNSNAWEWIDYQEDPSFLVHVQLPKTHSLMKKYETMKKKYLLKKQEQEKKKIEAKQKRDQKKKEREIAKAKKILEENSIKT